MDELFVSREAFLECLVPISLLKSSTLRSKAILCTENNELIISLPGMEFRLEVSGNLSNPINVPVEFFRRFAKIPPPGDPIRITVRDGNLKIGNSVVSCTAIQAHFKKK